MQAAWDNLRSAVRIITGYLKTEAHYNRVLNRLVLDLYRGDIDGDSFVSSLTGLIEEQFRRAWNQGASDVGFDPKDMEDDDLLPLIERMEAEQEHVYQFGDDIEAARNAGLSLQPLQSRVGMWSIRYNEIVNEARIYFGNRHRLVWVMGATEQHCETCSRLSGTVATAQEWEESGYHPQGAPNDKLECGGWRCDCRLEPTNKYRSKGGIPA